MPGKAEPDGDQWQTENPQLAVIGVDGPPDVTGQVVHLPLQPLRLGGVLPFRCLRRLQIVLYQIVHADTEQLREGHQL